MLEIITNHLNYKKQIFKLAKADLKRNYSGSFLGATWAIIKPCLQIFIYWFTFAIGIRVSKTINGYPYFLWLVTSMIPWFYMSDIFSSGIDCFKKYNYLVTKIKFPICNIPTFVSISKISINIVLIMINIFLFIIFGYKIDIFYLQLPLFILIMFIFFTSLNLILSTLCVFSRDLLNLIKSIMNALFWLSGILWDPNKINNEIIRVIVNLNPITFLVNFFRNIFINKKWFFQEAPLYVFFFFAILIMTIILSVIVYKKAKKHIPDFL